MHDTTFISDYDLKNQIDCFTLKEYSKEKAFDNNLIGRVGHD